jgi:outer membrane protein OmpA-like peptidoglycan-associated protein/flagellar hook assembly protein FlgD
MKDFKLKKHLILLFTIAGLLTGCETFKGDIPIQAELPEIVYISPKNMDGIQDAVSIPVVIPELKGLKIAGYSMTVSDDSGKAVYTSGQPLDEKKAGKQKTTEIQIPKEIYWNGKDGNGNWVADGVYYLVIEVWDNNKNKGRAQLKVIVDNTPPEVTVTLPYTVFSPNNDGRQDTLPIIQTASSTEEAWSGVFQDINGEKIKTYQWKGLATDFVWDGKNEAGEKAAEGFYTYTILCTDLAGNSFENTIKEIHIDNTVYPLTVTALGKAFSPNGDGVKETIIFKLEADTPQNIVSSQVDVIDNSGKAAATISLSKPLPGQIEFNGKKDTAVLPDGQYYARFTATYKNGSSPSVVSEAFALDTKPPKAVAGKSFKVFSPDGDGRKDEIEIFQTTSNETLWTGIIQTAGGKEIIRYTWNNRAVSFSWNGKDSSGKVVQDGEYHYVLFSTDEAGNSFKMTFKGITVDLRPTPVFIHIKNPNFSPNDDGIDDVLIINPEAKIKDGIINWKLSIENEKKEVIKIFSGINEESIPGTLTWSGSDISDNVIEGIYNARLEVEYEKGNLATAVTERPISIDISPPDIKVQLSPLPFSPDNDGDNDTLQIQVSLNDPSLVKEWNAVIKDPTGEIFVTLDKAVFKDGTYTWDGRSPYGELVQSASDYTLEINAEDTLGNGATKKDIIPVDILVLKDGDRLKIIISSIYFKAYTADYLSVEPDLAKKNLATLDRLAEILKKYAAYNIRLEGHAVRIYWNDPKKLQAEENEVLLPLSKKRAEAIRDALVKRGINKERMTTYGYGGYQPVVPHGDEKNRWKNRRVEFILIKK